MPKKISIFIIIFISLTILLGLSRQIADALSISKRVDQSADEVSRLQDKNNKLHKKLSDVEKYEFIEKIARDKLNLSKPNETVIVIPDSTIDQVLRADQKLELPNIPNWEGWFRLLLTGKV